LFWKLSSMIENGLTKKINPNTNIFNSVINAVQSFKELFTWRHNVAPNSACLRINYCALFNCSWQQARGFVTIFFDNEIK
jgi:hypothetical protein